MRGANEEMKAKAPSTGSRLSARPRVSPPPAAPSHERWLVSYADFMTLLFALFVVLFASSRHSQQSLKRVSGSIQQGFAAMSAYAPPPNSEASSAKTAPAAQRAAPLNLAKLRQQLQGVLGDSIAKQEIVVEQRPDGLVISLRELGFFDSGQARLLPGAADKIKQTAQVLMQHHLEVRVEGHSDDQPIHTSLFQSNWELSSARAMTVLLLMVNEAGFDPSKVSLSAFGPYHSLASNDTPEGRRMNRRVDLVVISHTPTGP